MASAVALLSSPPGDGRQRSKVCACVCVCVCGGGVGGGGGWCWGGGGVVLGTAGWRMMVLSRAWWPHTRSGFLRLSQTHLRHIPEIQQRVNRDVRWSVVRLVDIGWFDIGWFDFRWSLLVPFDKTSKRRSASI